MSLFALIARALFGGAPESRADDHVRHLINYPLWTRRGRQEQRDAAAGICLIPKGAYPFIAVGVAPWAHDLVKAQPRLTIHIVALSANSSPKQTRSDLRPNVIRMTDMQP
jgi:hypothetical protein